MKTMSAKKTETTPRSESSQTGSERMFPARPAATLTELRRFHLQGPAEAGLGGWEHRDLLPALLHPYRDPETVRTDYPLFLAPLGDESESSLAVSLSDLLQQAAPPAESARVLHDNLLRLERMVRHIVEATESPQDARGVLEKAADGLVEELHLTSKEQEDQLREDLKTLVAAVPAGGRLVPFREEAPLHLLEQAARSRLLPAVASLLGEVQVLAEKIRSLLDMDRMKRGELEGGIAAVQGEGSRFVNAKALSGVLRSRKGGTGMTPERRERLESLFRTLDDYLHRVPGEGGILVHDGSLTEAALRALGRWTQVKADDPCAAAVERFDEAAEETAKVLRAVQAARLEVEGLYDPARHDAQLARLDWESFRREELYLIPPVVVLASADVMAGKALASLSRLLRSGRPIQVVVPVWPAHSPGMTETDGPADAYRLEPGYLGMSHRQVLVQQTSAARPFHMLEGFVQATAATHAALHVVARGTSLDGTAPPVGAWLAMGAAVDGRAHPLFRYNPEAGDTLAERFDFSGNPDPEADWPAGESAGGGDGETDSPRFTFADFALLEPAFMTQFVEVAGDLPQDDLLPADEYLGLSLEEAAEKIPFVWGMTGAGNRVQLAMTRRMALAARDRLDFWRTLRELAGVRNEYARRAAEQAREEAEAAARAEREDLERRHAEEVEQIRAQAADETLSRLTAALMEVDPNELVSLPPSSSPLAAFAGKSVDEVAAGLLEILDLDKLDTERETPAKGGEKVDEVASELLGLIGPDSLEENA